MRGRGQSAAEVFVFLESGLSQGDVLTSVDLERGLKAPRPARGGRGMRRGG